jgi:hypothetical protein
MERGEGGRRGREEIGSQERVEETKKKELFASAHTE